MYDSIYLREHKNYLSTCVRGTMGYRRNDSRHVQCISVRFRTISHRRRIRPVRVDTRLDEPSFRFETIVARRLRIDASRNCQCSSNSLFSSVSTSPVSFGALHGSCHVHDSFTCQRKQVRRKFGFRNLSYLRISSSQFSVVPQHRT